MRKRGFVESYKPIRLNFPLKVFSNLLGPFQQSQLFSTLKRKVHKLFLENIKGNFLLN